MTHPIVMEALADAHHADLLRSAGRRACVVPPPGQGRRARLAAWLKAQLHHPTPPAGVTNAPRTAWSAR